MKKFFVIAALVLATVSSAFAENTTRIGSDSRVDYGFYAGYGNGDLGHFGALFVDINAAKCNLRTRISAGMMERWFNPLVGLDLQYLFPIVEGLCIYPTVGGYSEFYTTHMSISDGEWGGVAFNGGLGLEYQFSERLGFFVEGTRQFVVTKNPSRNRFDFGFVFNF